MTLNELIRDLRDIADAEAYPGVGAMPVTLHYYGDQRVPAHTGVIAAVAVLVRKDRTAEVRLDAAVE